MEKRCIWKSGVHSKHHNNETTSLQEFRLFSSHYFFFQQTTLIFSSKSPSCHKKITPALLWADQYILVQCFSYKHLWKKSWEDEVVAAVVINLADTEEIEMVASLELYLKSDMQSVTNTRGIDRPIRKNSLVRLCYI